MNFPTATDADWTQGRNRLISFLRSHGLDAERAEEVAQAHLVELLDRDYRQRCPATVAAAVGWSIRRARQYGIGTLTREGNRHGRRRRRAGLEQPQPSHVFDALPPKAPGWTDPAAMAEAGESLAARMPRYAQRARAQGMTPAALALTAAGWGPLDEDEAARTVPAIESHGAGYVPPSRGIPGMATATDPNPASREKARRDADAAAERVGLIVSRRA